MIFGASPILPLVDPLLMRVGTANGRYSTIGVRGRVKIGHGVSMVRINVRLQDFGGVQQGCQAVRPNWEGGTGYRPRQYKRYSLSSATAAQTAQPKLEYGASFSTRRPTIR